MNLATLQEARLTADTAVDLHVGYYARVNDAVDRQLANTAPLEALISAATAKSDYMASEQAQAAVAKKREIQGQIATSSWTRTAVNLLPRVHIDFLPGGSSIANERIKVSFLTRDKHRLHALVDSVAWLPSYVQCFGVGYDAFFPYYVIGKSALKRRALIMPASLGNGDMPDEFAAPFGRHYGNDPATDAYTYRPSPLKTRAFKRFAGTDARPLDEAALTASVDVATRCFQIRPGTPGSFVQKPRRKPDKGEKYYRTDSVTRSLDKKWQGPSRIPEDLFQQYHVPAWLARLTSRFDSDEAYLRLLDRMIASAQQSPPPAE